MTCRVQLTLFVPRPDAVVLEAVRKAVDPVQFGLIAAHVTLCREDELERLSPAVLQQRLESLDAGPIRLTFGSPQRFSSHGILLPCSGGEEHFRELRIAVLGSSAIRRQVPHLTLAHPRNPLAPGNSLDGAAALAAGVEITFADVSRIRQKDGAPWQLLQRYRLVRARNGEA